MLRIQGTVHGFTQSTNTTTHFPNTNTRINFCEHTAWAVINTIALGQCIDQLVQSTRSTKERVTFSAIATFCDSQPSAFGQFPLLTIHINPRSPTMPSLFHIVSLSASCTVSRLGPLFHFHMLMFAGRNNRERFKRMCRAAEAAHSFPLDTLEFDEVVIEETVRFCARLIVAAAGRGSGFNQQLYFYQMVASFRGLSRSGSSVLNIFGCGLTIRTYDKFRKEHQRRITAKLR
jgi:hypothetical protein